MPIAISPRYFQEDFPAGLSLDQKIEVFGDRVQGWQLDPAQELANKVSHSGFAVLHVVMSYFESVAKFRDGFCSRGESSAYFKRGFEWVFQEVRQLPDERRDELLGMFYEKVRCGLYHTGMTGTRILLTGEIPVPIQINIKEADIVVIAINPHSIVVPLRAHLSDYLRELRNPANEQLRRNFESRFDWLATEIETLVS
jgi:hypothetical protein